MRGKCDIRFERLADFAAGESGPEESAYLEAHLRAGCARCEREVSYLRRVSDTLQAGGPARPSSVMVRHTAGVLSRQYSAPTKTAPLLTRILSTRVTARLVSDSALAPAAFGVRGSAPAGRQLLYHADGLDIDLRIESSADGGVCTLLGQVLPAEGEPTDLAGSEVRLLDGRGKISTRAADRCGEFVFGHVTPGRYAVQVQIRDRQLELPELEMGSSVEPRGMFAWMPRNSSSGSKGFASRASYAG